MGLSSPIVVASDLSFKPFWTQCKPDRWRPPIKLILSGLGPETDPGQLSERMSRFGPFPDPAELLDHDEAADAFAAEMPPLALRASIRSRVTSVWP